MLRALPLVVSAVLAASPLAVPANATAPFSVVPFDGVFDELSDSRLAVSDFGAIAWIEVPASAGRRRPAPRILHLWTPGMAEPQILARPGYGIDDLRWTGRTLRWSHYEVDGPNPERREHTVPG